MAVYARSDVMSVAVPRDSGGCGNTHSRPVIQGAPVKIWKLDCPLCSGHLMADIKSSTVSWTDKDRVKHEYNTSTWSATPEQIPQTPDEERHSTDMEKRGGEAMARSMQGMAMALAQQNMGQLATDSQTAVAAAAAQNAAEEKAELLERIAKLEHLINGNGHVGREERPKVTKPAPRAVPSAGSCIVCGSPTRDKPKGPAPKRCAEHR